MGRLHVELTENHVFKHHIKTNQKSASHPAQTLGEEKTNSATFYTQVTQRMLYEKASLYQQHCTLLQSIPSLAAAGASRKPQNLQARDSPKSRLCTKKEHVP